jgi:hypothetical protein
VSTRNVRFRLRRATAASWDQKNPTLLDGELGAEGTPTVGGYRLKIGDGVTPWNSLPYMAATDLGGNGISSPTLSSIVVLTESEFTSLETKDPTTSYFVLPDPA